MQDIIKRKPEEGVEKVEVNKEPEDFADNEPGEKTVVDPNTLQWSAAEFTFREKTNDWYWTVGGATVALIILSYFIDNFLFAIISIIGGFSVALLGAKKPSTLNFKITEKGVQIENKMFLFSDMESFCINEELAYEPRLFTKMKAGFLHVITYPIHKEDIEIIKEFLKKHLKEEETPEPFASILIRLIGV